MRIIDLTLELADGVQTHPAHPRCVVIEFASHAGTASRFRPPCQGFASRILMLSDHIGTHVDSPFHFIPTGGTIEAVPLDRLVGPAICLDVSSRPPHQPVTSAILEAAEQGAGSTVRRGDILLVRAWPGHHTDEGFLTCVGLNREVAEWVVARGVQGPRLRLGQPGRSRGPHAAGAHDPARAGDPDHGAHCQPGQAARPSLSVRGPAATHPGGHGVPHQGCRHF
jgi:kynurenine formamidase